ncbi:hypothetical protein J4401_03480 [Candidatus Woesearchaeota archaeon]|nr:hypothetical protein [Candidatus Woesearchaeota archaeon]
MENFTKLRKMMDDSFDLREKVIQNSRKAIQASKSSIYAMQRDDIEQAEKGLDAIRKHLADARKTISKDPKLAYEGIFKVAIQEYVEAMALLEFVKTGKILPYSDEFMDYETYLMGICDLTGELVRKAINSSLKEDYGKAVKIKNALEEIYTEMSSFDFRNGELRRKFDGIKYELKKMDDIVFQLKMKDKI